MEDRNQSYYYILITILLWSAVPAIAKYALKELDNIQLLFYSNLIGLLLLALVIALQGKIKEFSNYSWRDYFKMSGMGILGFYVYYLLLYGSFDIMPAGQANMINYLWPVFVIIFSIPILKERFNHKTFTAIAISFAGAFIVITNGKFVLPLGFMGYILAAGAAVSYGLFSVLGKKLEYEKFSSMFVYTASSLLLVSLTLFMLDDFTFPKSSSTILAMLFLGGLANSIGFVLWFKALSFGNTHKIANIIYINPFLSLLLVNAINGEIINFVSLIGLVFIVLGIAIQIKNKIE